MSIFKAMNKINSIGKDFIILFTLLLIMVLFSVLAPGFLSLTNFINVLRQISMLGIVATGVSFVMIAGGMDLSIGSIMSISSITTAIAMVQWGFNPFAAVIVGLLVGAACGAFNGWIGVILDIHPLIVTLGTMTMYRGISFAFCNGLPINGFPSEFTVLGQGYLGGIPVPVIIFILYAALASFVLKRTILGRQVYAIGGSVEVSRLAGISVSKSRILIYMISGISAAMAGIILCSRLNNGIPGTGTGYEFDVMTAAVLGGISISGGEGKVSGVIVGVIIIGVLSNGLVLMNIGDYYQSIIKGAVLLLAVSIDVIQRRIKNFNA